MAHIQDEHRTHGQTYRRPFYTKTKRKKKKKLCELRPSESWFQSDGAILAFQSLAVSLRTTRSNTQKFKMVLALRSVFCTDLRTNSDFCFIQR